MMVDDTENNEFRELLSDYTKPVSDDGFTEHVLMQAQKPRNTGLMKHLMIGGATVLAALITMPQLGKISQMLGNINLPTMTLPSGLWDNMAVPNLTIFALMALAIACLSSAFVFSSDV